MLGTRGCRLGIEWPDVYRMQVAAIMNAACTVKAESGDAPDGRDHDPAGRLRGGAADHARPGRRRGRDRAAASAGSRSSTPSGTMIELPRAALRASEIATQADFFSFGTNDLTQTTLGFSRDDAETKFLAHYLAEQHHRVQPVRDDRPGRAWASWSRWPWPTPRAEKPEHQAGHLRRARRRPGLGDVLPPRGPRLRVVLALPGPDGPHRRGPRGAGGVAMGAGRRSGSSSPASAT